MISLAEYRAASASNKATSADKLSLTGNDDGLTFHEFALMPG